MSIEASQKFNQTVRRVEFCPFEWSANLLAVCFADSVKIFSLTDGSAAFKKEDMDIMMTLNSGGKRESAFQQPQSRLDLVSTVKFQAKVEHFSWSPKTIVSTLKPSINFVVSDNTQSLTFCTATVENNPRQLITDEIDSGSNIKTKIEKFEVECIYGISFDHQNGELVAINADNTCLLWDTVEGKLRARFLLQSPGVNICWNREEKTKLMVGEKSGTIRIFSTETLKPVYSIVAYDEAIKSISSPLFSFDWSQLTPEVIVAATTSHIYLWNSSKSCLPEKTLDNYEQLKCIRLSHFKENLIGLIDGYDACSKLSVLNFKTNQTVYQSKNLKLLNSFSFHSIIPLVAFANEQQVTIAKING